MNTELLAINKITKNKMKSVNDINVNVNSNYYF